MDLMFETPSNKDSREPNIVTITSEYVEEKLNKKITFNKVA